MVFVKKNLWTKRFSQLAPRILSGINTDFRKKMSKIPGGGGVLWGKKDRDDHQKSKETTLKNTKP